MRWIGLTAIVLVLVGWGALPNDAGSSARNSAAFVTSSCPFSVNGPSVYSGGVRCGYLLVPENRQAAGSRRIKLAVAVFKAPRPSPAPDPLIYLVGGPGAAIVASLGSRIVTSGMPAYVGNRDFILIDQRGAGLSVPALDCPEVDNANYTVLEQYLSDGAALREEFDALRACRSRLVHEGVDLSAYNTEENAADIAALGPALRLPTSFVKLSRRCELGPVLDHARNGSLKVVTPRPRLTKVREISCTVKQHLTSAE